jgi:hypothetical protein
MSVDTWRGVWRPRPDNWGYTRRCCYIQPGAPSPGRAAGGRLARGAKTGRSAQPQSWGRSFVRLVGEVARLRRGKSMALCRLSSSAREGGFGLSTIVETVPSRRRATLASHYCELSHCGVTAAAYAAGSVFSARYSRAGPHDPPPTRCSVPGPFKDGDSLSGKSSIKRLSGS